MVNLPKHLEKLISSVNVPKDLEKPLSNSPMHPLARLEVINFQSKLMRPFEIPGK
jgi:hypothetical protein